MQFKTAPKLKKSTVKNLRGDFVLIRHKGQTIKRKAFRGFVHTFGGRRNDVFRFVKIDGRNYRLT